MFARLFAAAAMAGLSTAASAQDSTANLREGLGILPETILSDPVPDLALFVDMSVVSDLAGAPPSVGHLHRTSIGGSMRPIDTLRRGEPDEWSRNAGVEISEVRYFASFGTPPHDLTIWGLESAERAEALMADLAEKDFEPISEAGLSNGLANGAPMHTDLAKRDPANPWRGEIGQASFVAAHGNAILHAAGPQSVASIQQSAGSPSAAGNLIVETALSGIDQGAGGARIVQAMLISPTLGLKAADPMVGFLSNRGDTDAIRKELEAAMAEAGKGIPPYFGGILADAQIDNRPTLLISLTYPDCETATAATQQIAARWEESMGGQVESEVRTASIDNSGLACAALVTVLADEADGVQNVVFDAAMAAIMRRQFPVLQIGSGS